MINLHSWELKAKTYLDYQANYATYGTVHYKALKFSSHHIQENS